MPRSMASVEWSPRIAGGGSAAPVLSVLEGGLNYASCTFGADEGNDCFAIRSLADLKKINLATCGDERDRTVGLLSAIPLKSEYLQ
jgi:hypothetical protein